MRVPTTVRRRLASADLLLNIGGVCWLPEFRLYRRRVLIDMDPFFTQTGGFGGAMLGEYHLHLSYGANIGRPGCTIPTLGIDWRPTVPPVVLELWRDVGPCGEDTTADDGVPATGPGTGTDPRGDDAAPFTTIANWSAYGATTYQGERYGQKDEEFLRLLDLPGRTSQPLELAVSGADAATMERLRTAGWSVRNAAEVSAEVAAYRAYVGGPRGEFSAAKHAYVKTHSGRFSDQTVCYLAAGRPAVIQETGFSNSLPSGRGVLSFRTVDEAAEAPERVGAAYAEHCRAAREIAERVLSYEVVLPRVVDAAMGRRAITPALMFRGAV